MSDLISRQAAIERFDYIRPRDPMTSDYTHGIDVGIALCKVAIREQPPAQHGTTLAEVGTSCSEFPNNSDTISRQAAIDAAIEAADDWDGGCNIGRQKRIEKYIRQLPSAEPKKIRGQWSIKGQAIDTVRGYWAKCSACGHSVFGGGNYCSYCGSYNKGEVAI